MTTSQIILSVSQLTQAIKLQLEQQFRYVVVQGEISNFKKQLSNHIYFTLKDSKAQIQCVMFQFDARTLKALPKDGDKVEIRGEVNVYAPRGNYQIIVRSLQPTGLGELLVKLQERKEKYLKLGYFDTQVKKSLPHFPKTIGVITSATGAVIRDILQILDRRAQGYHLILNPVKVQGEGSSKEIAKAINDFNKHKLADVLIVARGGGSIEDLWSFNSEEVIESVYSSQIPIISAVGHETDTTLCDLAADLRAPTPSAAAELVLKEKSGLLDYLEKSSQSLLSGLKSLVQTKRQNLQNLQKHPFITAPKNIFRQYDQQIDEAIFKLNETFSCQLKKRDKSVHYQLNRLWSLNPKVRISKAQARFKMILEQINYHFKNNLKQHLNILEKSQEKIDVLQKNNLRSRQAQFEKLTTHLAAINPKNVLDKGYSIVFDEKSGSAIVAKKDISLNQNLKLVLKDGYVKTTVNGLS